MATTSKISSAEYPGNIFSRGPGRFIISALILALVILELFLAFLGPMAFRKKTSIIVAAPYSTRLNPDEEQQLREYLETALAKTGQFRIISEDIISAYYLENYDIPDFHFTKNMQYKEMLNIAADLEIEQVAFTTAYRYEGGLGIGLYLRSVPEGDIQHKLYYVSPDLEGFEQGISTKNIERDDGRPRKLDSRHFDLVQDLKENIRGIEIFDYVFFVFMAGQIFLAVLLLLRQSGDGIIEPLLLVGLLLFLFSFVYARNAGLDYVQRFIASSGQIDLAPDTFTEQLYAFIRFMPLLLVNLYLYIRGRIRAGNDVLRNADFRPVDVPALLAGPWGFAFSLTSALLFALSFPSFVSIRGFALLGWIALIPLLLAIIAVGPGRGIFYGVSFGMLSTLLLNYWHGTYSYISLAFSVGLGGLIFALWVVPWVLSIKFSGKWGFIPAIALWVVFEYLRSIGYIAYPWGLAGVSQYSIVPMIQSAELGGVYFISFILLCLNAGLAWFLASGPQGWQWFSRRRLPLLTALLPLVLSLLFGSVRLLFPAGGQDTGSIRISLIQQSTDPRKHDYLLNYETLKKLSLEAMAEARSEGRSLDLLVWPEGGFRSDIRYWEEYPDSPVRAAGMVRDLKDFVSTKLQREGIWLLTGTQDYMYEIGEDGEKVRRNFNSTVLIEPDAQVNAFYHKIHLVPFTEHFPYKEELPGLAKLLDKFNSSNWKQGDIQYVFDYRGARFFTPICFEDIFPDDLRKFASRDVQLIVNTSNDYWSLTPVEGKQHAIHALFRSVENRIPTVRATASGLTTSIDAMGRLNKIHPEYYSEGYLIVDVALRSPHHTVYQRAGDWIVWLSALLWIGGMIIETSRRVIRHRANKGL